MLSIYSINANQIRDPTKKRVFYKYDKREGIFNVNATAIGTYEFIFSNLRVKQF